MKISIIIPVYGVESYIEDFLDSLIFQITSEVEVIFINDGTRDKSILILKEYIEKKASSDLNIIILEQENQGQSAARNYGISVSSGKYVTFLDPDDLVSEKYIDYIFKSILSDADLIQFNAYVLKTGKNIPFKSRDLVLVENNDFLIVNEKELVDIFNKKMWFSWLRVVKKDFLDADFYPKGVNYQDMMAFPQLYKKVKNIKNLNEKLVYYRIHETSSVNGFKPKLITSADYGINLYSEKKDFLDNIIYKQFIDLRMKLLLQSSSFLSSLTWYYFFIFRNSKSLYYKSLIFALRTYIKFAIIYIYMIFKKVFL